VQIAFFLFLFDPQFGSVHEVGRPHLTELIVAKRADD
jgi:hypothetical protein